MTAPAKGFDIFAAMDHEHLWRSWFRDERSWKNWRIFLAVLFGLPVGRSDASVVEQCTGRGVLPAGGFNEAWLVCGRRAGKSFILALVACFLSVFKCRDAGDWRHNVWQHELER